jgi:hypothetical protein
MSDDVKIKQLGAHNQCAKVGCAVRAVAWRVILGTVDVQVYVCTVHLSWACTLDMLSWDTFDGLNWARKRADSSECVTMGPTKVTPMLPHIKRTDFARPVEVSESWPVMREVNGHLIPTWSKEA